MTAACLGDFGAYKYAWSRHRRELEDRAPSIRAETVWVTKRYTPKDLRVLAPVPRHKLISDDVRMLPAPEPYWIPPGEMLPRLQSRDHEERGTYTSQVSTRCEEWSTLRQMLPSRGRPLRDGPPNWGTGYARPPSMDTSKQVNFPHLNSPMTRYTDAMHLTNRLYKLH